MDVGRLSEVLSWIRANETLYKIQAKLASVNDALANLAIQPTNLDAQQNLSKALHGLFEATQRATLRYTPEKMDRLSQVKAIRFVTNDLYNEVVAVIARHPMRPSAAAEEIGEILSERQTFIRRAMSTKRGIDMLAPPDDKLSPGSAEIGFELPRSLFSNTLDEFIGELRFIRRVIRVFSEFETGSVPEVQLGKISSTDPLVFVGAVSAVVLSIGRSVSWLLVQWKTLEEIRKLKSDSEKIGISKEDAQQFFGSKIDSLVKDAVTERVKQVSDQSTLPEARKAELDSELQWALLALFARLERGMRVEVRVEALPDKKGQSENEQNQQIILTKIRDLAKTLVYPKHIEAPSIRLPRETDSTS